MARFKENITEEQRSQFILDMKQLSNEFKENAKKWQYLNDLIEEITNIDKVAESDESN